jgi:hypothetical protein
MYTVLREWNSNFSDYLELLGRGSSKQAYSIGAEINIFLIVTGLQCSRSVPELVVKIALTRTLRL